MPRGKPNKRYTAEFKKQIIESMMEEKLSYRETSQRFEISYHKLAAKWERINLAEVQLPRAENDYLKKLVGLGFGTRATPAEKTRVVQKLRQKHKLEILLSIAQLPHATFYYHLKRMDSVDKQRQRLRPYTRNTRDAMATAGSQ